MEFTHLKSVMRGGKEAGVVRVLWVFNNFFHAPWPCELNT